MNNEVDFFSNKFVKSIHCDKPQQDGFSVNNLLREEKKGRNFFSK
jgi:hypothetical protein